ncbi:hypothetical protein [Streptomyces brasiliensis]|uniref:LigA protein n=1 Tax=Streptomyces brasiliensis TaxID=1954 RepID=A0A917L1A7_9ACTN|nr:hypothetical protein [Streptomyces brasiliensis]GGJ37210.1 hypothetical protein GCM10010121_055460 [Streptomyces brasiliensis]
MSAELTDMELDLTVFQAKALVATATVALVLTGASDPASAADPATWQAQTLPDAGNLLGVTRPDARTAWAVGFRSTPVGKAHQLTPILLTRQDGAAQGWTAAGTAPLPDGTTTRFNAVTALSGQDGWVVGDDSDAVGGIVTEHWDGTAWRLVPAPAPTGTDASSAGLLAVSGTSADDVWAVGWAQIRDGSGAPGPTGKPAPPESHQEGLVEHWDGTAWQQVPLPEPSDAWGLNGVTAIAEDDVWAVGYGPDDQPVLLHFDGQGWTHVADPALDGSNGEFNAVAATGPGDVWAVGRIVRDDEDPGQALVAHWNGRRWRQVDAPPQAGRLSAVTATPDGGVTAVGRTTRAPFPGPGADGYAMRLDDRDWRSLALPSGTFFDPNGVAVSADGRTTLVGVKADPDQDPAPLMALTDGQ